MRPSQILYVFLFIALILISILVDAQVNTGNSSLPTGSYGKKDTFAAKDLDRPVNTSGVTRETIRVQRNADKNAGQGEGTAGDGSVAGTDGNGGVMDTAVVGDATNTDANDTTAAGMETTIGDNASCNSKTSLFIAIALLTIALLTGTYLLSDVMKDRPTNQLAGTAYAVLLPISTAIVAFFTMQCTGPAKGLVALVIAVALGLPLFFMRTMSKPSPKWLITTHALFAVAGYGLLIAYVATR